MSKTNDYWRKREEDALRHYISEERKCDKELKKIYADMLAECRAEIDRFYGKYAAAEKITITEAKRRVAKLDIEAYERKAKRYVKEKNFSQRANEEMRLYNATMKINRLEMLKANIGLELISGHDELDRFMAEVLKGRTMDELTRQAGILGKTIRGNAKMANSIVNASFHNATFSQRVWSNLALLQNELNQLLQRGLIQGKNPRELARDLRKAFDSSVYHSERLMRTELARVQIDAQKKSFEENGFEHYEFIANANCCDSCQRLNGKHFEVKKMTPGENAAPLHPNCRCSVAAWEDSEDYDAWLDYLSKGGTTEEWNRLQKAEKSVAKKFNSGIIKLTKISSEGRVVNPMDKNRYFRMKKRLIQNGCSVISAKGDDEKFLLAFGAEAISDEQGIIHLGEIPSASAFFEEIIHYTQVRHYGSIRETDFVERAAREIAANRKLLRYGNAYGFTDEDFSDISRNLKEWEQDFKERTGISYDESNIKR